MISKNQLLTEPQDQVLFAVEAETFLQFCALLDAPAKHNAGLARLMALTPPWSKKAGIEDTDEAK